MWTSPLNLGTRLSWVRIREFHQSCSETLYVNVRREQRQKKKSKIYILERTRIKDDTIQLMLMELPWWTQWKFTEKQKLRSQDATRTVKQHHSTDSKPEGGSAEKASQNDKSHQVRDLQRSLTKGGSACPLLRFFTMVGRTAHVTGWAVTFQNHQQRHTFCLRSEPCFHIQQGLCSTQSLWPLCSCRQNPNPLKYTKTAREKQKRKSLEGRLAMLDIKVYHSPGLVAQWVGASLCTSKGCEFNPQSGQVQTPVGAYTEATNRCFSHGWFFLSWVRIFLN